VIINIQFEEASKLMYELLAAVPEDRREQFAQRVNRISSVLHHPPLNGAVVLSVSSDDTDQPAIALRDVVPPL
jgi:hypothetical protein